MFHNTGQLPDLAGRITNSFFDFYNPLLTKNVLVDERNIPILIDTNFSRTAERFGTIHNFVLARGLERTIQNLQDRENRLNSRF